MALVAGLVLIVFGIAHLRWPTMFRRGIFLKTSVPFGRCRGSYVTYMNVLGVLFILAGIVVVLLGALGPR